MRWGVASTSRIWSTQKEHSQHAVHQATEDRTVILGPSAVTMLFDYERSLLAGAFLGLRL